MYFETYAIVVMMAVWIYAMASLYKTGWNHGSMASSAHAAEVTLNTLKENGFIDIVPDENGEDIIVRVLPSPEETKYMAEVVRAITESKDSEN